MRGDYALAAMELPSDSDGEVSQYVNSPDTQTNNLEYATEWSNRPGSLYWLLLLTVLYGFWGWWESREGMKASFSLGNMKINLLNFVKITIAVVIGINLMQVFLTKVAAMRIPIISRIAGAYMPLFSM